MGKRLCTIAACVAAAHLAGFPAYAQEAPAATEPPAPVVDGRELRLGSGPSVVVVDLGCDGRATLRAGDKVFVACGGEGVVEFDVSNPASPRRAGRMAVDGEATGLFLRNGRVWVEISHVDARPVRTGGEAPGATPVAQSPSPAPAPEVIADASPPPPKHMLIAPPRRGGLWELSATAGGFFNIGPPAAGVTGSASAVYRFDEPLVVRAEFAPLGFAVGQQVASIQNNNGTAANATGAMAAGAAHLLVGLDTQFFEIAVGGGAATVSNNSYSTTTGLATGGVSIVEEGRLGARDGLALNVETVAVSANNQLQVGNVAFSLQVPLTPTVMLIARGGAGNVGVLYGDIGARVLLRGDGGPDTIAVTGYLGGAGIDYQTCSNSYEPPSTTTTTLRGTCAYTSIGGPSLGGGIEWRR